MGFFDFLKPNTSKPSIDLSDFKFVSDDHNRIENGQKTNANNKGAWRGIRIQTSDSKIFTVSIYNLTGTHPVWGDNVQMAPKQMKLIEENTNKIFLRGFGTDTMGASFADYGITLHKQNKNTIRVTLHMFDRNTEIVYLKGNSEEMKKVTESPNTSHTIEKQNIQGKECIIIKVKIENETIPILGAISSVNSEMIEYNSYRSKQLTFGRENFSFMTPVNSFVNEITFMAKYLNENGMTDKNFEESLHILAKNHITKNGRMIDNDMYGLVDMAVFLKSSITAHYKGQLNKQILENMWLQLLQSSLSRIKDSFYVTKYDLSNPLQPRPYLEKML